MKTLIVEDSSTLGAIYQAYLDGTGLEVHTVETFTDALSSLESLKPQLILLDIELPDGNGLDLLAETVLMDPQPAVVVMTGHGIEYAEQAMERGADDFLAKPFDASRLRVTLTNAAEKLQLAQQLREISRSRDRLGAIVGGSKVMQAVYESIDALSASRATAFITGESGTGKELVARAIHDMSARAPRDFVTLNCSALPSDHIEAELFGIASGIGSSTEDRPGLLQQAHGGTLFLDEVCDMPYDMQALLLRFLQEGTFKPVGGDAELSADARVIASTNRDPLFEMREGRLREDLFYRLHVVPLRIPPLRKRGGDVLQLTDYFLQSYTKREKRSFLRLNQNSLQEMSRYPWPGNVRQLENIIHRLVLMSSGDTIDHEDLQQAILDSDLGGGSSMSLPRQGSASRVNEETPVEPLWLTEKRAIQAAIEFSGGNINKAAGLLEVAPSTIYRKIQFWKSMDNN